MRKLSRLQLLELLVLQAEETETLRKQLLELQTMRTEESVRLSQLGSMAEVSAEISGVLEAAQKAAELYLEAAQKQADAIVEEARQKAEEILRGTESEA